MKIGFDGKRAVKNNTGLGNYSRLLIDILATRYPDNEYLLYTPELKDNPRLKPVLAHPNVRLITPQSHAGKALTGLWRVKGVTSQLKTDGIDLMHGLSGELPLDIHNSGIASVVTMHDLIFRRLPQYYKAFDRQIYDYKFRKAAENATRILAISECTKRDLITDYGIDGRKIDVVYQGCADQFKRIPDADEIASVKARYGLDRPYIISVGTIEHRKNQMIAVRGMRGLADDFELVLVGRRTDYARTLDSYISTYGLGNRVKFIENAAFTDLPALYAGALCSTYTSRYEGFGIPVIESLNTGTPVVVATGSCLEEAGGPDTPAINPDDVEGWLNVVKELANYPEVREKIARAGRRYVEKFNDTTMSEGTMACYAKALYTFNG